MTPLRWSLTRALSYFFGNKDVAEELSRLRGEAYDLRERLLEKARVRPLSQKEPDRIEISEPAPPEDLESWKSRREQEALEQKAFLAATEPALMEELNYYVEVDPELYGPVAVRAGQIKGEIAKGTYKEFHER